MDMPDRITKSNSAKAQFRQELEDRTTRLAVGTFKLLDGLVTNFHLPESTLIMLVSAFAGYENVMHAYKVAVEEKYRFFSFGDCCLFI